MPRPFALLEDLSRIIASEWLVSSTYSERELNNMEVRFERPAKKYNQQILENLLLQLMRARRRVTKYDSLVSDQLHLCPAHWKYIHNAELKGQAMCPLTQASPSANHLSPLRDFDQVRIHLAQNNTRISEAIKLVMSLMSVNLNNLTVEQNRLAEARNSSLAVLTGVTSFLLPFTAVTAFMAIPPESGLGPR